MRLFVAIDIPESIKEKIHPLIDKLLYGARWTSPEQWHITLHFIGESDDMPIREVLKTVKEERFDLQLRGIGTFPERGKPNVLWVGIDTPDTLKTLHQATGEALKTMGFVPESRPYNPHLTLARFKEIKPSRESLEAYLAKFREFETERFAVESFALYQSELLKSGAVYTVRERFSL